MARKIFKFPIDITGYTTISISEGAKILTLQIDQKTDEPCIWAEVNTERVLVERKFVVVATGISFPDEFNYIGTFQVDGGEFVGHLFEIL